jgi:copper chaperone
MIKEKIIVEGMSCNHCVMALKKELTKNEITVIEAGIGFADIEFDESKVDSGKVSGAVKEAGFTLVREEK